MLHVLDRWIGRVVAALTSVYRFAYSRRLPRVCCYEPTCSVYAALAWSRHGLFGGMSLVVARLRRCTGGAYAGEDWPPGVPAAPVPGTPGPRVLTETELRALEQRQLASGIQQLQPRGGVR